MQACLIAGALYPMSSSGKRVDLELSEGAYSRSFKGSTSPVDLETCLQLMHLLFKTQ